MDERIARLKSPEECEQFIRNVQARLPDLAKEARRRAVELRAASYGAKSTVEEEAVRAIYAHEETLCSKQRSLQAASPLACSEKLSTVGILRECH